LFAMKLVTFLEQEYNIIVDNDDLDIKNFNTVDNIISLINRKCSDSLAVN
jgi:acyl carrier protein